MIGTAGLPRRLIGAANILLIGHLFLLWMSVECSAVQGAPMEFRGSIYAFAQSVVDRWARSRTSTFLVTVQSGSGYYGPVFVNITNSTFSSDAIYRNNCVATPFDSVIDCDLKLVDDLIDEFKLVELFQKDARNRRNRYRKYILCWILAHELGHVILKHGVSDFSEDVVGARVFDFKQQKDELAADAAAVPIIGNLTEGSTSAYQTILDITNSLLRKAICPESFPKLCSKIPIGGVGLYFDYTSSASHIKIPLSGGHPAFVARFLRILYLSGVGTSENSINYLAKEAIDQLMVERDVNDWVSLRSALEAR